MEVNVCQFAMRKGQQVIDLAGDPPHLSNDEGFIPGFWQLLSELQKVRTAHPPTVSIPCFSIFR